jgi:hypothetical protein
MWALGGRVHFVEVGDWGDDARHFPDSTRGFVLS